MRAEPENRAEDDREALEHFLVEDEALERLETILDEFNPFEAMRWTRQELRHSAFLRWLLDPSETHGLQSYFLRSFLKWAARTPDSSPTRPTVIDLDAWKLQDTQVVAEWESVDIFIRDDDERFLAVIENKVDTSEHSQQLARYRSMVEGRFPQYKRLFVYLTPVGEEPSDDAYIPISYNDLASLIAEVIRRKADQLNSAVRDFVQHYVEMLRRRIVEDSEIQELCRRIYSKHRRALDVLFENRPDRASDVSEFVQSLVGESKELILDAASKSANRFIPKQLDFLPKVGDGWTRSKRLILFQVENMSGTLLLKAVLGPGPKEVREQIRDALLRHDSVLNKVKQRFYPKWWTFYSEKWVGPRQYEELDAEALQAMIRSRFEQFLTRELPPLVQAMRDLRSLKVPETA